MEQKKINQERSRKYGRGSTFVDKGEPSKAPRQDESGADTAGPPETDRRYTDDDQKQGISNRPARDERAFPPASSHEGDTADSVETTPKQQGGNRGGV